MQFKVVSLIVAAAAFVAANPITPYGYAVCSADQVAVCCETVGYGADEDTCVYAGKPKRVRAFERKCHAMYGAPDAYCCDESNVSFFFTVLDRMQANLISVWCLQQLRQAIDCHCDTQRCGRRSDESEKKALGRLSDLVDIALMPSHSYLMTLNATIAQAMLFSLS